MEGIWSIVVALFLTFLLGTVSYFFIELPIWRPRLFFEKRKVWALIGGLCIILVTQYAFSIIASERTQQLIGLSVVTKNSMDWYPHATNCGATGKHWSNRRLFSVGDSHASAYGGLFRMIEEQDGVSVYVYSYAGDAVASLVQPASTKDAESELEICEDLKKRSRPGDVVLLAHLRVKRLCEAWGDLTPEDLAANTALDSEPNRLIAIQEGERFISKLKQLKLQVIIEAPLPVFKAPPFRGSDWFNRMNPVARPGYVVDRDYLLNHRAQAMQSIYEVQANFTDIQVWDPFWTFCFGTNCSAFDGTKPMFFDGDHLSDYGGRKLYPSFKAALEKFWN